MKGKLSKVLLSLFTVLVMLIAGAVIASADVITGPFGIAGGAVILILGLVCLALVGIVIAVIVKIRKKNDR